MRKKTLSLLLSLLLMFCCTPVLSEVDGHILDSEFALYITKEGIFLTHWRNLIDWTQPFRMSSSFIEIYNGLEYPIDFRAPGAGKIIQPDTIGRLNMKYGITYQMNIWRNGIIFFSPVRQIVSNDTFYEGNCPEQFHIIINSCDDSEVWDESALISGEYSLSSNGSEWDDTTRLFGKCSLLPGKNGIELVPSAETMKMLNSLPAGSYELLLDMNGSTITGTDEPGYNFGPIPFTVLKQSTPPATGDGTPAALYAVLGMLCLAACAALFIRRRRV